MVELGTLPGIVVFGCFIRFIARFKSFNGSNIMLGLFFSSNSLIDVAYFIKMSLFSFGLMTDTKKLHLLLEVKSFCQLTNQSTLFCGSFRVIVKRSKRISNLFHWDCHYEKESSVTKRPLNIQKHS